MECYSTPWSVSNFVQFLPTHVHVINNCAPCEVSQLDKFLQCRRNGQTGKKWPRVTQYCRLPSHPRSSGLSFLCKYAGFSIDIDIESFLYIAMTVVNNIFRNWLAHDTALGPPHKINQG